MRRSGRGEFIGRADQSQDDVTLEVVAGRIEHEDGRGRLASVHEEVRFGPSSVLGGGQRERQGGVLMLECRQFGRVGLEPTGGVGRSDSGMISTDPAASAVAEVGPNHPSPVCH